MSAFGTPPTERVGKFKVLRRYPFSGFYVTASVVYREGERYFVKQQGRHPRLPVRRLTPPRDYDNRRSEGLIEFEVVS